MSARVKAGSVSELVARGFLTLKVAEQPVCVFWHDDKPYALDDRCPHMGFPLHRGTVHAGLLTCHWHHARFDLASGGTLDPFADDVRSYPVEVDGGEVYVLPVPEPDRVPHHLHRLDEGLEQGLTLVIAKAVLGLLEAGVDTATIVRRGVEFGARYRGAGWGAGLTVLVAMANVAPHLEPEDRALALVHGLAFVSRDTRGHSPRFPLDPLGAAERGAEQLGAWYRRFVETRSADAAERVLASAIASGLDLGELAHMMGAAATDHVFLDGGHTMDFTNKAFEALDHLGPGFSALVLPTVVAQAAAASRAEETGPWRYPDDLTSMLRDTLDDLPGVLDAGAARVAATGPQPDGAVEELAWALLEDDPAGIVESLRAGLAGGISPEQAGRAVAYAAALRIARFHTQNDHGDWDVVHHGFTTANAVHQLLRRSPSPELVRGALQGALKVYLDRFLNVPPARLPGRDAAPGGEDAAPDTLAELATSWDEQGHVDDAGAIAGAFLAGGGDPAALVAALGHALLAEDAEFHWFQTLEAAVRQHRAWAPGSEPSRLILVAAARFLAAHTPTRRELPQVVRTATRLRRGEVLFEAL